MTARFSILEALPQEIRDVFKTAQRDRPKDGALIGTLRLIVKNYIDQRTIFKFILSC